MPCAVCWLFLSWFYFNATDNDNDDDDDDDDDDRKWERQELHHIETPLFKEKEREENDEN